MCVQLYVYILPTSELSSSTYQLELSRAHTQRTSTVSVSCIDLNLEFKSVDNLYLHITLCYCVHEQKAHGLQ